MPNFGKIYALSKKNVGQNLFSILHCWNRYLIKCTMHKYFIDKPEAEFKEFEPRFKLKPRFKYYFFHLNLY